MKDIMDFVMDSMGAGSKNSMNSMCSGSSDYNDCTCLERLPLAYSYTPMQELDSLYSYSDALKNGTLFPELNMPLGVYGKNFCKKKEEA